jgi:hypothetical protein
MEPHEIQDRLDDLEKKISRINNRKWFNRNVGLITFIGISITFIGYLATTIIGGYSLKSSNENSSASLKESQKQFNYILKKDAQKNTSDAIAFKRQERINRHQDSLNIEQLKNYKSQTKIAGEQLTYYKNQTKIAAEQLTYFKRQTAIADTQLKSAQIIYQQQLDINKPVFMLQEFSIDSTKNKPELTLKFKAYNGGKRNAYIKKLSVLLWNVDTDHLFFGNIPVGGDPILPASYEDGNVVIPQTMELDTKTICMFQFYYKDEISKSLLLSRIFLRFSTFKPMVGVQVDEVLQRKLVERVQEAEKRENRNYLSF